MEKRVCQVYNNGVLSKVLKWKGVNSVVCLTNTKEYIKSGKTTIEKHYYITSLPLDSDRIIETIRSHWSIENNLHWQLDTQFGEDASQIHKGHSPENLAVLRKISKLLLQMEPGFKASIHRKQRKALMVHDYLLSVLAVAHLFE